MPHFTSTILNWFFPPLCVHCQREGSWWCSAAAASLDQMPVITDARLPDCDQVLIRAAYDCAPLAAGIQKLKYHYWTGMQSALTSLLEPLQPELHRLPADCVLVPVPLHTQRIRQRGFNQSVYIAQALSSLTGWPVRSLLMRTKHTRPQVQLNGTQRQTNVADAFAVRKHMTVPPHVVLVDDVITTGATITACARQLRPAGVQQVFAVAIAKG